MKLSVVTAVFNGAGSIQKTIDSVLAQQDVEIDYWIVDAASTDGTVEIIRRHENRLAGWTSEPDKGIADGFNKGLARARGRYVMFLSADDALAHPRALADLAEFARAHPEADAVYGDCDLRDPRSGEVLYRVMVNYDRARFLRGALVPHPGMLMHRRYFERYGNFDTSFRIAMDYELFLRGFPLDPPLRLPQLVTNIGAGGASTQNRALAVDENIRALRMHGYLNPASEAWLRARYAARGVARRGLEAVGLYRKFEAMRRRKARAAAARWP